MGSTQFLPCSTLRRVEPYATCCFDPSQSIARAPCSTLRRVEPHATLRTIRHKHIDLILQYPQTGRTSCNSITIPTRLTAPYLAVPSDGSNLMQHLPSTHKLPITQPCIPFTRVELLLMTPPPL